MKELKRYVCEKCEGRYSSPEMAQECETQHKVPTEVEGKAQYKQGKKYPFRVTILFGKKALTYRIDNPQCTKMKEACPEEDDMMFDFDNDD
jgi:hypothetical protein